MWTIMLTEKDKLMHSSNCQTNSLYRSHAVGDFYGPGIEIWAGLATFEAGFFMFSWVKK